MSNDTHEAGDLHRQGAKPFISVVIPFYNCEKTVDACLRSVLAQTFADFEVICVDDGSDDGTLAKLNGYAAVDPRLTVIARENGGQASARNLGVSASKADLVAFVDGDDVCSPYYLEAMAEHFADGTLVCGQNLVVRERGVGEIRWPKPARARHLTKREAVLSVLYNVIEEGPSCKLIPRQTLLNHPFPAGRLYEDLAVIGDIVMEADSVAFVEGPIYAYVMHEGSTVRSAACSISKVDDYEYALGKLCNATEGKFDGVDSAIVFRKSLSYLRMRPLCKNAEDGQGRARQIEEAHEAFLRGNLSRILRDDRVPKLHKVRFSLRVASPRLYDCLMHAYNLAKKGVY